MSKLGNRLSIGILSLGYVIASVFFIIIALGWRMPLDIFETFLLDLNNRWVLGLTSAIIFLISSTWFLRIFKVQSVKQTAVNETALGQINITLSALEQLILKASKGIQGVREVKPTLKISTGRITVLLKVQVLPDLNIPQVTAELQEAIKDYLLKTAGTSVQEIKIQVAKISWDTKVSRVD